MRANPSLQARLQRTSIERTLPATMPSNPSDPYGWQDPAAWVAFGRWMFERGLLAHDPGASGLPPFTNEFLPGQGI
jgi:hypothetical protein